MCSRTDETRVHFRFPEEEKFCEMLVDLCETVHPNFTIVDAVDAMEGDGPSGGTLRHTGMILAGKNPYDVDLLLCDLIGFHPQKNLYGSCSLTEKVVCSFGKGSSDFGRSAISLS